MIFTEVNIVATPKSAKRTVKVKPVQKKTTAKSPAAPPSPERKELTGLLNQLDTAEINWLITQAKTMIYNRKVEEVNRAAQDLVESKQRSRSDKKVSPPGPAQSEVDIVQAGSPKNYNILMGNARLFINLDELKALVRIAHSATDPGDGGGRLFRWFKRERNDVLIDAGLSSPTDSRLRRLYEILKDRFTSG